MNADDHNGQEVYDFGWWPELAGAAGVVLLIGLLMVFARGTI